MPDMRKLLIFCLLIAACKPRPVNHIHVQTDKNGSLKFSGIEYQAIAENSQDTSASVWQAVLPVYKMPVDTDMKDYQPTQPGKYKADGQNIVFTPDTPFIKGQLYFVRCYDAPGSMDALTVVKNRGRIGKMPYIDLIFKY